MPSNDLTDPAAASRAWAVEHFEETTGRDLSRDLDGEAKATRTFEVYTSSPTVPADTVRKFDQLVTPFPAGTPGAEFNGNQYRRVPRPGDKYVELNHAWSDARVSDHVVCVDVQVRQDAADPRKWSVSAQYAGTDDPLAQPHEVDWDEVPYQEALLEEVEALPPNELPRPIVNGAGDLFAEGVMTDADRLTVTIVKNVLNYSPVEMRQYRNTTNAESVFASQHPPGFPAGQAKLKIKAKRMRRSGNTDFYWRVTAVVEIDERGWDARVRDVGWHYLDPESGQKRSIAMHPRYFVGGAHPPATPQPLGPEGTLLDPDDPLPPPLQFRRYKRKSWGALAWLLNY
ncbi:MAG TPA: hypothetical protein VD866_16975 [Urbifossiella sp.]|nr:hypothetical protein [Urbifossiella sp.]